MQSPNLNLQECIDCKACMKGCLMLHAFTDSPKSLLMDFQTNKPSPHLSFSCATCNYCYSVCPVDISFDKIFFDAKKEYAKDDKTLNVFGYKAVRFHQKNSFSKLFTAKTNFKQGKYSNMAFMPGCSLSSYLPSLVQKIYAHLNTKLEGINILQQCCGQPTRIVGDMQRFETLYTKLKNDINAMGIDTVISACENCYMSLKEFSPHIKVITLYEILAQYGIPKEKVGAFCGFQQVALHDPCPTREQDNLHTSIRAILDMMSIDFEELKFNKRKTQCCGSGGMLELTNPKLASKQMRSRAEQTTCSTIVTYCQSCAESMSKGGKNGVHILDLLFCSNIQTSFEQKRNTTIQKWFNRYKSKRMIEKL
ncbi:MAG: (Fe-S)-binding protein [Sulfurospirillum sp.]|nr:(Fe-S)-binding protein [Sulfurospirillum sp.]